MVAGKEISHRSQKATNSSYSPQSFPRLMKRREKQNQFVIQINTFSNLNIPMASNLQEAPPPPYPDHQDNSSTSPPPHYGATTSHPNTTLSEKHNLIPSNMHLYDHRGLTLNERDMYVLDDTQKTREYGVQFCLDDSKMTIRRVDKTGPVIAQTILPYKEKISQKSEQQIEIEFFDSGGKVLLEEKTEGEEEKKGKQKGKKGKIPNVQKVQVQALGKIFWWVSTGKDENDSKGKGKVGNVEFVDGDGEVLAVFLNEWKAKGVEEHSVGKLELMEGSVKVNRMLAERVVVSLLVLVERYQFMEGVGARQKVEETAEMAIKVVALTCVVS